MSEQFLNGTSAHYRLFSATNDSGIPAGPHEHWPTLPHMGSVKQYEVVRCRQCLHESSKGNCCFLSYSDTHCVQNAVVNKKGKLWLLCNKFLQMDDLCTLPLKNDGIPMQNILRSGRLGIWKVSNLSSELIAICLKTDMSVQKCVLLSSYDTDDMFVAITMLHDKYDYLFHIVDVLCHVSYCIEKPA